MGGQLLVAHMHLVCHVSSEWQANIGTLSFGVDNTVTVVLKGYLTKFAVIVGKVLKKRPKNLLACFTWLHSIETLVKHHSPSTFLFSPTPKTYNDWYCDNLFCSFIKSFNCYIYKCTG